MSRILADLALPLKVLRKLLIWVDPLRPVCLPVFASARDFFYGFPNIGGQGVKLAIHWSEGTSTGNVDEGGQEPTADEVRPVLEAAAEVAALTCRSSAGRVQASFEDEDLLLYDDAGRALPDRPAPSLPKPHFRGRVFGTRF